MSVRLTNGKRFEKMVWDTRVSSVSSSLPTVTTSSCVALKARVHSDYQYQKGPHSQQQRAGMLNSQFPLTRRSHLTQLTRPVYATASTYGLGQGVRTIHVWHRNEQGWRSRDTAGRWHEAAAPKQLFEPDALYDMSSSIVLTTERHWNATCSRETCWHWRYRLTYTRKGSENNVRLTNMQIEKDPFLSADNY